MILQLFLKLNKLIFYKIIYKIDIMRTVVLIGMMGTGKTSVGKTLAEKINVQFADLDIEIEKREGLSVSDIFKSKGEEYFRKIEQKVLREVFAPDNQILSLGGGAFEDENTRKFLLNNATVVYLKTSPEIIFSRLKNDVSRPLLKDNMSVNKILELINSRSKNYKLAQYTVVTDNKTTEEISKEIIECASLM